MASHRLVHICIIDQWLFFPTFPEIFLSTALPYTPRYRAISIFYCVLNAPILIFLQDLNTTLIYSSTVYMTVLVFAFSVCASALLPRWSVPF